MNIIKNIERRFNISPVKKNLLNNIYWALLGKVTNIITSLLVGVLVARYLGPSQFGLMNYVVSYVTIFSVVAAFGLDSIEVRELAKDNLNKDVILGTAFFLRLFLALCTLILILITLFIFETDSETFLMILIYSLSILFSSLNVIRNYYTSIVLNKFIVKSEIFRSFIGAGLQLLLLLNSYSLIWFISASMFNFILVGSGYLFAYRKQGNNVLDWQFDKKMCFFLLKESFPLLLSGTAIIIYQKIDQVIIKEMLDDSSVGLFAVASKLSEVVIFIPLIVSQTVSPILIKSFQKNNNEYIKRRQQFLDITLILGVLMATFIFISAKLLIINLYGIEYLNAIPVLKILAFKVVFVSLFMSSGQLIIIEGIQKYASIRNVLGCIISILLNIILIPIYGIVGSAIAAVVTFAISGYFSHIFIRPYRYIFKLQTRTFTVFYRIISQGVKILY